MIITVDLRKIEEICDALLAMRNELSKLVNELQQYRIDRGYLQVRYYEKIGYAKDKETPIRLWGEWITLPYDSSNQSIKEEEKK